MQPQTPSRLVTRSVRHPFFRPEHASFDRLRKPRGVRGAGLVRGVRVLDLLAPTRPTQILQAVVGRVVIDVIHGVLVVPLGEAEGARHQHVDSVLFAVAKDLNVAAFLGFGSGNHAIGRFETPEGGDLWFGGSFGSFGDFDHFFVVVEFSSFNSQIIMFPNTYFQHFSILHHSIAFKSFKTQGAKRHFSRLQIPLRVKRLHPRSGRILGLCRFSQPASTYNIDSHGDRSPSLN